MNNLLQNLNEKQLEAVRVTEGPVMAIAGAGSGKTSVLTKRIAYLIDKSEMPNMEDHILAITFTNKAAREMQSRIMNEIAIPRPPRWVSTFHSMCARILRQTIPEIGIPNAEFLGYKRNFVILDDDDTLQSIKSIMKKLNYDTKMYNPKVIRNLVVKSKFDKYMYDTLEEPFNSVVRVVARKYKEKLQENNLVDFENLQLLVIKLLKEHKSVQKYYHDKFMYVHVDEFQDTNDTQYELLKLLVNKDQNLFIVGDQDQSIYAFRGANIKNIDKFKKDFPKFHLVLLEQNYRSTNNILKAANKVISHNKNRIPKNLYSTKGDGDLITHFKGVTARDEVEFVAKEIIKLVRKGYEYNDFAILYRANSTSRQYEDVFLQKNVPYRIRGNTSFFKRKEIKDFAAYLRLILNLNDAFSMPRVVQNPRRGIGDNTLDKLFTYAADNGLALTDALAVCDTFLPVAASNKLKKFYEMLIDFREKLDELPFSDYIDYVLENSGYVKMLQNDEVGDVRYENLLEFKTMLAENNEIYQDMSKEEMLSFMLEDISLKAEQTNNDIEDGVTMLSVHAAKGLEFRVVFIVAAEDNMFPLARSLESLADLEEERRLMYVGITRAKEKVYLTCADTRQTFGDYKRNDDSIFVRQIPQELIEKKGMYEVRNRSFNVNAVEKKPAFRKQIVQKRKAKLDNYTKNDLNKGDKINHTKFGDGIVVSIAGDNCVIAFQHPHGVKKLLKDHPAITKK